MNSFGSFVKSIGQANEKSGTFVLSWKLLYTYYPFIFSSGAFSPLRTLANLPSWISGIFTFRTISNYTKTFVKNKVSFLFYTITLFHRSHIPTTQIIAIKICRFVLSAAVFTLYFSNLLPNLRFIFLLNCHLRQCHPLLCPVSACSFPVFFNLPPQAL